MDYGFHIKQQDAKIKRLELLVEEILDVLDQKDERISFLEKENKKLKDLLTRSEGKSIKKNSRNSNLPPSKDIDKPKRTKSLRKKSNKKPGGQPGHEGYYLELTKTPDKIISLYPDTCTNCGDRLNKSFGILDCSRQEIDIPPVQAVVYQYDRYEVRCTCGCNNVGKFPERLRGRVQYGPVVRSMINYSSVYQYIPFKRLKEMMKICFGVDLSEGTVFNTLQRTAKKGQGLYQLIKEYVGNSEVVGADETVVFVNGKKWYDWVWQNKKATYIACENSRRKENIYKHFAHGFPNAILVSDRYASHLSTPAKGHQICWVHLLRRINYLKETEDNNWLNKLMRIYESAKRLSKLKTSKKRGGKKVEKIEKELNKILLEEINGKKYPETKSLQKKLLAHRGSLLTFLYHPKVPSHNNASELAIRNAKVKMKISGCFKSAQQYFAVIRSIIDTLIKNKQPVFENLLKLEKGEVIKFGF